MSYSDYPTAKENINTGKWEHLKFFRKGLGGIHYYAERQSNGNYRLECIHCTSELGYFIFGLLRLVLTLLRWVLNLINKGLGNEAFDELIDEINVLRRALRHNENRGRAYQIGYNVESINKCYELIEEDVRKILKQQKSH